MASALAVLRAGAAAAMAGRGATGVTIAGGAQTKKPLIPIGTAAITDERRGSAMPLTKLLGEARTVHLEARTV